MRDLPALIVAVLFGGLILFGLLWLWFWFEQNSSSGRNGSSSQDQSGYSSQDQSGYSSQYQNGYDNGYSGNRNGYNRYSAYGNGYNAGQSQPIDPYVPVRRRARPCYNPCY
jgi:hypothetical protein